MDERTLAALVLAALAVGSRLLYDHRGRRYAEGKSATFASPRNFRSVYAWVSFTTVVAGLGALLSEHPLWLPLHRDSALLWAGLALAVSGFAFFVWAKRSLGPQYSPCFDAWLPTQLIEQGAYERVRHPIYTANLLVLAGLALATGSAWVLANLGLVAAYYLPAARREESALTEAYPEYAAYHGRTGRFLPRLRRVRV